MSNNRQLPYVIVKDLDGPTPAAILQVCQLMGEGVAGVWTATPFEAPKDSSGAELTPEEVFQVAKTDSRDQGIPTHRFCIRPDFVPSVSPARTMFIYTDGACLDNGSDFVDPRGGAAFVFSEDEGGKVGFALEHKGPDGKVYRHTSNRAELRAVNAALAYRMWHMEKWERMVIVTDSEYVANHATVWLRTWASRKWRVASGKPVANIDLWRQLSNIMASYAEHGCEVSFWRVPRRFNAVADQLAKEVAAAGDSRDEHIGCFCSNMSENVVLS